MYTLGVKEHVDMETIIQSYNMGPGYIHYVAANGFKHSEKLAKGYSKKCRWTIIQICIPAADLKGISVIRIASGILPMLQKVQKSP
ncbi:hypothetical protein GCM10020331_041360 [Ectobacillus funiculus]